MIERITLDNICESLQIEGVGAELFLCSPDKTLISVISEIVESLKKKYPKKHKFSRLYIRPQACLYEDCVCQEKKDRDRRNTLNPESLNSSSVENGNAAETASLVTVPIVSLVTVPMQEATDVSVHIEQQDENAYDSENALYPRRHSRLDLPPRPRLGVLLYNNNTSGHTYIPETNSMPSPSCIEEFCHLRMHFMEVMPLVVSRENIISDFLKHYSNVHDLELMETRITFSGELGADYGGLTKDAFSAFVDEFIADATIFNGYGVLVPSVAPNLKSRARITFPLFARVLWHSIVLFGYFPQFPLSFYLRMVFEDYQVPKEIVFQDFFNYLSPSQRATVEEGLKACELKEEFPDDLKNALTTLFSRYKVSTLPTACNLRQIVQDIAESIIIEMPDFYIREMKKSLNISYKEAFLDFTPESLIGPIFLLLSSSSVPEFP